MKISGVKLNDTLIVCASLAKVPKEYCIKTNGYYARVNYVKVFDAYLTNGFVPEGLYIFDIRTGATHEAGMADPFTDTPADPAPEAPEAAPEAAESAPAPEADKSPDPAAEAPLSPLEALMALPDKDPAEGRTNEQNAEFHGTVAAIAAKSGKKPEDVKKLLVEQMFGRMRRTRDLSYGEMERLIHFSRAMAAAVGAKA